MNTPTQTSDSPVRILIAEDSPTQAQRLRHILEEQGYEVAVAANGRLALEMAPRHRPALILSDVVMPEVDGYELSRRVKADSQLRHVPVILVTTLSDPHDVIRGLECGADHFVLKPYDERYLLGQVRYVLVNREMRRTDDVGMGVEVHFNGQRHFITADRLQILNLLLSTYDAAIQRNRELNNSQEELRLLNERLRAANQDLEAFSYSVSHDLRAPLRAINGFSRILVEDFAPEFSEEALGHLERVRDNATRMGQLIDDLLAFSRLGRLAVRKQRVSLKDLVHLVFDELRAERRGRSVDVSVGELPDATGDPALLKQVLVNLLSNAVKFTRDRDDAAIEVGWERDAIGESDCVYFVRDNGAGFDMRYSDKLFGVFQRLHGDEEYEGTGVGLAIVKRIVERHGGRVWADSQPGHGATFYFTLEG